MATYRTIEEVPPLRYSLIMADPPWEFMNRSEAGTAKNASAQYACSGIEQLAKMPVSHIAQRDAVLWLWATNPMLDVAFELMRAWGFTFKTAGHWSKKTRTGKQAFGTGYIFRCAGEPYLIGTLGNPVWRSRSVRSVIEAPVRQHSRKPDLAFEEAVRLCGDVERIELFSRQERAGWDVMGYEADKFSEPPAPVVADQFTPDELDRIAATESGPLLPIY